MSKIISSSSRKLPRVRLSSAPAGPNAFRRMIDAVDGAGPGDLVGVYDKNGAPYGVGLFNPKSQIALRIFSRDNPDDFDIAAYFSRRVAAAVALRRDVLKLDASTDAYRLVHDYADGLPGLTADRYAGDIVLEFYSRGMYNLAPELEAAFREHFPKASFHHRASSYTEKMEGFEIPPGKPKRIRVKENGVLFEVNPAGGYKTGFFCDQRDNRLLASTFAGGKRVIDICAYTGGFGITAAKLGGAMEVTCVELDPEASEQSKRNANINGVRIDAVCSDAFPYMRQSIENKKKYGLVVLDPYKLVPSRDDKEKGMYKYRDFNRIAMALVEEGGVFVTCSCSGLVSMLEFTAVVRSAAQQAGKKVQILRRAGAGGDHPVAADYPEGEYLKCLFCRVS